jgi:hypothetical protein
LQHIAGVDGLLRLVQLFLDAYDTPEIELLAPAGAHLACDTVEDFKQSLVELAVARATAVAEGGVPEQLGRVFAFFTLAATRYGHLELERTMRAAAQ